MELIRGLHNIGAQHHGCVLTIGKFDGVHLGHQAVLKSLIEKARTLNLPAMVMVFEPQPEEHFFPASAPARLSLLRDKYLAFKEIGIDTLLCVRFNKAFASMSPQSFVQELLVQKLGVKFLVVGDDFKFGFKRRGDFSLLQQQSLSLGFDVVSTESFRMQQSRISSTAIRQALEIGEFELATRMLGKPFSMSGTVFHGEKNGRTIGYPTANILVRRHKSPLKGVFAAKARCALGEFDAVVNLGKRPTLHGQRVQLEAHLFDFAEDLYGQQLTIEFVSKLRDELKFPDFQALKQQIKKDAEQAKRLLTLNRSNGKTI